MVRLRCCNHWLHEDCLSKSVLDGRCPTCRIWLASLDEARVLVGAVEMGDVQKVKELLEKHTPCTAQDYYGRTPLHLAVLEGHEEVVKELLSHGVDTSTADFKGRTALHLAAHGYSLDVSKLATSCRDSAPWRMLAHSSARQPFLVEREQGFITMVSELTTFHPFPRLPDELRLLIWNLASAHPRTVTIHAYPRQTQIAEYLISPSPITAPLHTCRESRTEALTTYTKAFHYPNNPRYTFVNFHVDTIRLVDS
ncbi:ankyrin repeat-containing domain protein [Rhexocercosporidium sp. MPI-PUGE-AT-0058]|nr:ankyrin repeat-containing domain protein [Rhexocercosporidium sp. MPI-PUGE-AT-0058]